MNADTIIFILGCIGIFGVSALAGGFVTNLTRGQVGIDPIVRTVGIIGCLSLIAAFIVAMLTGR